MPRYDVRCRTCGDTFELNRSITRLDDPMPCPQGHDDTVRLLPAIGVTGRAGTTSAGPGPSSGGSGGSGGTGGGCCGGGCCG